MNSQTQNTFNSSESNQLPPEFADQIAEARFVDEVQRLGLDNVRFMERGDFVFEADEASALVDGLITDAALTHSC